MGWTIKTSFCLRVTFSMRSPVAMSNGCAPVLASYSAITLFTSSISAVAGSYSRSVVSPWDENVRIFAFMFGLLWHIHVWSTVVSESASLGPCMSYCTVSQSCQDGPFPIYLLVHCESPHLPAPGSNRVQAVRPLTRL